MPAIVKQRVHLALVADLTQLHLFVRDLKRHGALAVALALFEAARVHVARFGVDHLALAVGLAGFPFAGVGVAVGVGHGALAGLDSGDEIAGVGVAGEGNDGALSV